MKQQKLKLLLNYNHKTHVLRVALRLVRAWVLRQNVGPYNDGLRMSCLGVRGSSTEGMRIEAPSGRGVGKGFLLPIGKGVWGGDSAPPQNIFWTLSGKWCLLVHSGAIFWCKLVFDDQNQVLIKIKFTSKAAYRLKTLSYDIRRTVT